MGKTQVSDFDHSTDTEDKDAMGWRNLSEIATSEDSESCDTDKTEGLDNNFYEQNHTISNLEYATVKLSNFVIEILSIEPIIALYDTGATCSCISHQLFMKISYGVDMTQKSLKVNTSRGTTFRINRNSPCRTKHL